MNDRNVSPIPKLTKGNNVKPVGTFSGDIKRRSPKKMKHVKLMPQSNSNNINQGVTIRTKFVATPGRVCTGNATVKSRNSAKNDTASSISGRPKKNLADLNGSIRLPSMAKCLQFKILPRE